MARVAAKEKEIDRLKAKLEAELDESKDKVKLNPKQKEALRKLKNFLKVTVGTVVLQIKYL